MRKKSSENKRLSIQDRDDVLAFLPTVPPTQTTTTFRPYSPIPTTAEGTTFSPLNIPRVDLIDKMNNLPLYIFGENSFRFENKLDRDVFQEIFLIYILKANSFSSKKYCRWILLFNSKQIFLPHSFALHRIVSLHGLDIKMECFMCITQEEKVFKFPWETSESLESY